MNLSVTHLWAYFGEFTERPLAWEIRALIQLGVDLRILSFRPARAVAPDDADLAERVTYLDPVRGPGGGSVAKACALLAPSTLKRPWTLCWGHNLVAHPGIQGLAGWFRASTRRAALARELRAARPSVLHAQHGHVGWWAAPVARRFGLPLVVSVRGADLLLLERLAFERWRELVEWPTVLLTRSDEMSDHLQRMGAPRDRVVTHRSGIPVRDIPFRERRPVEPQRPVIILSVGRLIPKKGMEDTISALAASEQMRMRAVLRIVGEGPSREHLEDMARQLGISRRVKFLGRLTHAETLGEMAKADLFCLASRSVESSDREGIPNVLKEASASGLPIISTTHAGIPEAVENGETGLLVQEGNVEQLVAAMDQMLDMDRDWADMGRKGRALIEEKFDVDRLTRRLVERYEALVKEAGA